MRDLVDRGSGSNTEPRRARLVLCVTHPMTARYLLRGQASYLRQQGFEVTVVASPGADLERFREREAVATVAVPMDRRVRPLRDLLSLLRLARALRRLRPDLVSAGTPKAGVLGVLAAWLTRVPVRVYTLRGLPLETTTGVKRAVLRWVQKAAAAAAHRVVCVSHSLRRRCLEIGICGADKAIVVAHGSSTGVDLERFRRTPARHREAVALRRQLGIAADAPVVGCVGRFTRDKGIDDLAEAFLGDVLAAEPDAHLLLVGDFESDDPVAPETRRGLASHPQVTVTGWVTDSAPYYTVMDLLALPSYREGFPNAPLEAAAAGLPTVGYRAVGTVDAVDDHLTGTLVPLGDRRALGGAVVAYLADVELRRSHGDAARDRAERLFRREIVWRAWAGLYRRLLDPVEGDDA